MHTYGGLARRWPWRRCWRWRAFWPVLRRGGRPVRALGAARAAGAAALLFAALWTLAELARGRWFTGFPWGAGGYAHVDGALAALPAGWACTARLGGGLAGGAAGAGPGPARRAQAQPARGLAVAGLLAALLLGWGLARPGCHAAHARGPAAEVALLQGNIRRTRSSSRHRRGRWRCAGTASSCRPTPPRWWWRPKPPCRCCRAAAEGYWAALQARYARPGQAALLGMPLGDLDTGYTNSAVAWRPGSAPYRYDKHHLVPFGEFIPPLFRWFVLMNIPLGDFTPGAMGQPSFAWQGQRLAPNICYEDLFGEELAARFADPATAPTAFVNLSNIGWFGDTVAIDQHLAISRMRALEFERPMLRATNTGATAIVDAQGRVTQQLPRLTRGVLRGTFQGGTGITPYAAWAARWGLAPLWGAAALIVLAAAAAGRRGD
jgi:apolipoprotein N-acyltransferase